MHKCRIRIDGCRATGALRQIIAPINLMVKGRALNQHGWVAFLSDECLATTQIPPTWSSASCSSHAQSSLEDQGPSRDHYPHQI
mmetsp:Transcript_118018/g.208648  ORF Transcript_118018/g.208648 Transcript_118018/m.208648 type:complete len:84 (-) Transcript_118018:1649-1900(-)